MTQIQLEKLRTNLPKKFRTLLARQFKCSKITVDLVLSGQRENLPILKAALELAAEYKKEIDVIEKGIEDL